MTENNKFQYHEEENGEFPFPYIQTDGGTIITLYDCCKYLNALYNENEQLKKENKRLKRSIAPSVVVDANVIAETIATCRGITVEEYFEEVEAKYTKGGLR